MRRTDDIDPIVLSILWSRLIAVVDEAAATLYRTSFSPVVRESNDYACVLLDSSGNSLVQSSWSIPSFIGTLPRTVKSLLQVYPVQTLAPGDVVVSNDPWLGTGHLNDINVMVPVFHTKRMVAIAASTAHAPDIGGRPIALENKEIYEEGLRIPVAKLFSRGRANKTVFEFIRHNVRVPDQVVGDLMAQVAANELAAIRLTQFMDEYQMKDLTPLAERIHRQSELATRAEIRKFPSAQVTKRMMVEGIESDLELVLTLSLDQDLGQVVCDYAGTSPQQAAAFNVVPNYTYAYSAFAIKCLIAPDVPNNEGCLRPVTVGAPEGSLLNPTFPAAVGARSQIGHYLPTLVFTALSDLMPDRVRAAAGSPIWAVLLSGQADGGSNFAGIFFYNGGMGGAQGQDGHSCISFPSNTGSTPIEVLEQNFPIRFLRQQLVSDSAGVGQWRGGFGQIVEFELRAADNARLSVWTSHTKHPATGLLGGQDGSLGKVCVNGQSVDTARILTLRRGDRVLLQLPGGGGFGNPALRDQGSVRNDQSSLLVTVPGVAYSGLDDRKQTGIAARTGRA